MFQGDHDNQQELNAGVSEIFDLDLLVNEDDLLNEINEHRPAFILFQGGSAEQQPEEEPQQPEPEHIEEINDDDDVLIDPELPALPPPAPVNVMQISDDMDEITTWFTQNRIPELAATFRDNGFTEVKYLIQIKTERLERMNLNLGQLTKHYLKRKSCCIKLCK